MDSERTLIERAAALSKALTQCPIQKLAPFAGKLEKLSSDYQRLILSVNDGKPQEDVRSGMQRAARASTSAGDVSYPVRGCKC